MKYHHLGILTLIASLLAVTVFAAALRTVVFANTSTISVSIGYDACYNIPGLQPEVPAGMVVDDAHNCSTPAPDPIDLCANLPGDQEILPTGYYRDSDGNCHLQPSPPEPSIDVCSNLTGIQASVPEDYVNDADGNCIVPPTDVCANIDGMQASLPDGMTRNDDGICATPPGPVTPAPTSPTPPATPSTPSTPAPTAPEAPATPIASRLPQAVVASIAPYVVLSVLGIGASVLWIHALHEGIAASSFLALLRRERRVAKQKGNFVTLAMHQLHTQLIVMTREVNAAVVGGTLPETTAATLRSTMSTLEANIEALLTEMQAATAQASSAKASHDRLLHAWRFWLPVITSIVAVIVTNLVLGTLDIAELDVPNAAAQAVLCGMIILFFYGALRNHRRHHSSRTQHEQLIASERATDEARDVFYRHALTTLQHNLQLLYTQRAQATSTTLAGSFDSGYTRSLVILDKLHLLVKLQASHTPTPTSFNLRPLIDGIIIRHSHATTEKRLTIVNRLMPTTIIQQRKLVEFVINSLVDNAIKFSNPGGTITIDGTSHKGKISLSVSDAGIGLDASKQAHLLSSLTRARSATLSSDDETGGLSLLLDQIIMDYLGGDISVASQHAHGSTFTITISSRATEQAAKPHHSVPKTTAPLHA